MNDMKNKKISQTQILSYIMIIIFIIIEILSIFAFGETIFAYLFLIVNTETPIGKVIIDIIFMLIINILICGIPIVTTIIQFFCDKKFFKVQLVTLGITMFLENIYYICDLLENLSIVIKNLF